MKKSLNVISAIAVLLCGSASAADVVINEFMAINDSGLTDANNEASDWIELYNSSASTVDLSGWHLTDRATDLSMWTFPATNLSAGGYLVVFASGTNASLVGTELHANFKLNGDGEYLALVEPNGVTIASEYAPVYPPQEVDVSYGIFGDRISVGFFSTPTPGGPNASGFDGFAAAPQPSVPSGCFIQPFVLAATSSTTGAVIRYETNGALPTASSPVFPGGGLAVDDTMQVRAQTFAPGYFPSDVVTWTYFLLSADLHAFSSDLPIVILDNFGAGDIPAQNAGGTPQFASLHIFEPKNGVSALTNAPHLSSRSGITRRGSSTLRATGNKPNLTLESWGEDDVDSDIAPLGMPAESDWILYRPFEAFDDAGLRNPLMYELSNQMGQYAVRTRYVVVLLNYNGGALSHADDYEGVYVWMERIKRNKNRVDIEKLEPEDSDEPDISGGYMYKIDRGSPAFSAGGISYVWEYPQGSRMIGDMIPQANWLKSYIDDFSVALNGANFTDPASGYAKYIDVDGWIEYNLMNMLAKNVDALRLSTYLHKGRERKINMGPIWDFDRSLESTDGRDNPWNTWGATSGDSPYFDYSRWDRLFQDPDFQQKYIDRWYDLRDDVFSNTNLLTIINRFTNEIAMARSSTPSWPAACTRMVNWLENRVAWIDGQFIPPPAFSQPGGQIVNGFELTITAPANATKIYYTLDGSDPRTPGGGVAAGAVEYSGPIPLSQNTLVRARAWNGAWTMTDSVGRGWSSTQGVGTAYWGGPNNAVFAVSPHTVTITELMVAPRAPETGTAETNFVSSDFEFVEISNTSIEPVYLAGLRFSDGIDFDWSYGQLQSLGVGESAIAVNNLDAFKLRYPNWATVNIAGEFEGTLNNGGEQIRLASYTGQVHALFTYNSSRGWPLSARGAGHSLVPLITGDQSTGLLDYGGNWRASGLVDGSPGAPDPAPGIHVTINEIAAHTDTALPAPDDSDDWIELHNPLATPVDVSGWYLSDDADRLTFVVLPAGSIIAANGFMTLRESTHFHTNRVDGSGFGLNKAGESVFLSRDTGSGRQVVDAVAFKGQPNGPTLGRYADSGDYLYELASTTNAPNAAPQLHVLISELMVEPLVDTNKPTQAMTHEYVELYNPLGTSAALWTEAGAWRLDGGVDFVFPPNTTLAPSEYVLVVGFDPQDSLTLTDFLDSYGITNGQVRIFGPYIGRLDNRTERVALEQPQEADVPGDSVSWIIVDEVIYFVDAPWPTGTAGTGGSLQRSVSAGSGRDPGNWIGALEGTPGVPGTLLAIATPASGTRYFVPDTVVISVAVEALRVSNAVSQVVIRDGSNVLCVVTQEPYSCVLNIDEARSYYLSAEMTDGAGVHTSRLAIVDGLEIRSLAPTGVTDVAAFCVGALEGNGSASVSLYWGDEDGAEDAVAWDHIASRSASGGTPISIRIDTLTAGRTYYYRYRAEVAGRFAWSSNTVSFSSTPLSEWLHHVALQFPGAPASPLANFPVLIKLHEGISGFSYSQFSSLDGFDLRVGAGSNGEAIPYEIEHWDTGAVSYVWALVPALSTGTWVNVHWGNPAAVAQPPAYATDSSLWRDDYAAVWHLNADLSDASSHQADALNTGSLANEGVVAGGRLFDGVDDVMHQGPGASWYSQNMQDMTISVWAHPTAVGGVPFGAAVGGDSTQDFGFWLNAHPFVRNLFVNVDGALTQFGQYSLNEWCQLTLTVSNGVLFAAKNDLALVQVGPVGGFVATRQPALGNLAGGDDPFTGRLDELRVSTTTRSAAWIRATYRTVAENDAFTSYGTVVSGGPFIDADGNGLPDAWEVRHFGASGIDEQGHGDADPMDNRSEYVAGTDPTNSADFFWLGIETGAVTPVFYFNTRLPAGEGYEGLDRFYALEDRAIMSTGVWFSLPGANRIPATGTTFVYSNAVPATNTLRQYRSKVWLEDAP